MSRPRPISITTMVSAVIPPAPFIFMQGLLTQAARMKSETKPTKREQTPHPTIPLQTLTVLAT